MTSHPADEGGPIFEGDPAARPRRKRGLGCVPVLIGLVVVLLLGFLGARWGLDKVSGMFAGPPDYTGSGTTEVTYEVKKGDSTAAIGRGLKSAGVVKSVDAFLEAAQSEPEAQNIQVGVYALRKKMSGEAALAVLTKPANLIQDRVTVTEGARVRDIVKTIVARTDLTRRALTQALDDPDAIGLPAVARGNPEGYLYPATYDVKPGTSAQDLISQMVAKTVAVEEELDIRSRAERLGRSPEEILTLASIIEYEANRDEDYAKVARVFYNRLDQGMPLQSDATVSYASGREGDVWTTAQERASDNAYNTYKHTGLPPGPIGSPGAKTIEAALAPAEGNWLYFVPDFEKKTTLFTADYQQHLRNVERAKEYCRNSEEC